MANHRAYEENDNLIDWSAFDESAQPAIEYDGSKQLRVVSIVLLFVAVAGIALGVMEFNSVSSVASQAASGGALAAAGIASFAKPVLLMFFGLLTFIPAAFGFQTAKSPVVFVTPTVLGLAGIVVSALGAIASLVGGALSSAFDPVLTTYMLVCTIVAVMYLVFVVRVHKAANAAGGVPQRKRPTKEERWDEDKIWR